MTSQITLYRLLNGGTFSASRLSPLQLSTACLPACSSTSPVLNNVVAIVASAYDISNDIDMHCIALLSSRDCRLIFQSNLPQYIYIILIIMISVSFTQSIHGDKCCCSKKNGTALFAWVILWCIRLFASTTFHYFSLTLPSQ